MKRVRNLGEQGFSIIELMATLAILAVVTTTVFVFIVQINDSIDKTESRLAATTALYAKYQDYETKTFSSLSQGAAANSYEVEDFTNSLPSTLQTPRSAKVYIRDITPTLKKIDVRITYQETIQHSKTINVSSTIQESGIGR